MLDGRIEDLFGSRTYDDLSWLSNLPVEVIELLTKSQNTEYFISNQFFSLIGKPCLLHIQGFLKDCLSLSMMKPVSRTGIFAISYVRKHSNFDAFYFASIIFFNEERDLK